MNEPFFWLLIGAFMGFLVGFALGHVDGREKAYKYELRRLLSYTRRARSILGQAKVIKKVGAEQ